jgi:hypothetical protein
MLNIIIIIVILIIAYLGYTQLITNDCVMSEWDKCDPITKTQARTVQIPQSGNGAPCGETEQKCIPDVGCVMSDWDKCNSTTKTQTRTIIKPQSGNGAACGETQQKCIPDIGCVMSDWSAVCDETGNQTRTVTTPQSGNGAVCGPTTKKCAPMPKLLRGKMQWQYHCEDCGGLVWHSVKSEPWNRYYKASCQNGDAESALTPAYGPVGNNNYNNPVIRISDDWKNNACGNFKTNIYRSRSLDGPYTKLDPTKLNQSWSANPNWDDKGQGRFIDKDDSTLY